MKKRKTVTHYELPKTLRVDESTLIKMSARIAVLEAENRALRVRLKVAGVPLFAEEDGK